MPTPYAATTNKQTTLTTTGLFIVVLPPGANVTVLSVLGHWASVSTILPGNPAPTIGTLPKADVTP